MTDKLDDLVSGVQKHVADKRAELTALQTQLRALQSAHADLHNEVEKAQTKLLEVRNAIAASDKELDNRRKEASAIANGIIADAHLKQAAAEDKVREIYAAGAKDVARVAKALKSVQDDIATAKVELQNTGLELNEARGKLAALKAQAGQFANS